MVLASKTHKSKLMEKEKRGQTIDETQDFGLGMAAVHIGFYGGKEQLGEQLLRVAHVFAASLDAAEVEQVAFAPPDSELALKYRALAQRIADEAGLAYAYTCTQTEPGTCVWGVVSNDLVVGDSYAYGSLPAADAWGAALAGVPAVSPIYADEYGEWKNGVVPVRNAAGDVVALAGVDLDASFVRAQLAAQLRTALLLGGLMLAIWLFIARWIARRLIRPVTTALARFGTLIGRVADGELAIEELDVRGNDEVATLSRAFNAMVKHVRELEQRVASSAHTVASSAEQLTSVSAHVAQAAAEVAQAVTQVADGAANQSGAAQEAARVMTELRAAVGEVTRRAGQATSASKKAMGAAEAGAAVVEQTVAGMNRIQQSVLETAAEVRQLGDLGQRIGEITDVITDIADQTNLLALNAAIEAARAGEHGGGFAVVAEEVRRLAERSATSAGEIADLIASIQTGTDRAVRAMEQGTADVTAGTALAADAGKALGEILAVVQETTADVETIAQEASVIAADSERMAEAVNGVAAIAEENTAASEQMAAGAEQVSTSVEAMAAVSAENVAAAEQVSASVDEMHASAGEMETAARSLAVIARELQQHVGRFRL